MAVSAVRTFCALSVALIVALVRGPRAVWASSLSVHLGDKGNATCPWRFNLVEDDGNTVERCIGELSITFPGTPSGSLTAHALPEQDGSIAAPPGYKMLNGGNFYKLHSRRTRWHAAKHACEREGAHLMVLDSAEEAEAVRSLIAHPLYETPISVHAGFFVGLVTVRGERLPSTWHERWVRTDPAVPACGQMDSDGFLLVASCGDEESFICEYESSFNLSTDSPTSSSSAPSSQNPRVIDLPKGYEAIPGWNNSYYHWGSFKQTDKFGGWSDDGSYTWNRAQYSCQSENADLASFESEEEIQAIIDMLQKKVKKDNYDVQKKIFVGVRTGGLITVLGDLVHESGKYSRWKSGSLFMTRDQKCFWVDYKLMLHLIECIYSSFPPNSILCEIDSSLV